MDNKRDTKKHEKTSKKHRVLKHVTTTVLGFFLILALLILFIRSPWGQNIIKNRLVNYVSNKTNTKVAIDKLFITFGGDIQLNGLFLEDKAGDTLVYSKTIEANLAIWDMVSGKTQTIDALNINGLTAKVKQNDSITGFNYAFLISSFTSPETETSTEETPTNKAPILVKDFNFNRINITYKDAVSGIDSRVVFKTFKGNDFTLNTESMTFAAEALKLNNADIKLVQTQTTEKPEIKELKENTSPLLILKAITLEHVKLNFENQTAGMLVNANIGNFYTEIPKLNLEENNFEINQFNLQNSKIIIHTKSNISQNPVKEETKENDAKIIWPEINIALSNSYLKNNTFGYYVNNQKVTKNTFNPNAILLDNFSLKSKTIKIKDEKANIIIENIAFNEGSGFQLTNFGLDMNASNTHLKVNQLLLALNRSKINMQFDMLYPTLAAFIKTPEQSKVNLNIKDVRLHLEDIYALEPELKNNPYFLALTENTLSGNAKLSGNLSNINLSQLNINWGYATQLSAHGNIQNITEPNKIKIKSLNFLAKTQRTDLVKFINEKDTSIQFPDEIKLSGKISGHANTFKTDANLTTTQGIIALKANLKNENITSFNTTIDIKNYQINKLIKNPELKNLSASIKANGSGKNINTLSGQLETKIDSFQLSNYTIKKLNINGDLKNGKGNLSSNYKDNNINLKLNTAIILDSIAPEITVALDVIGADLQALGLSNRAIKTKLKLNADVLGNSNNYKATASINDGVVVYNNNTYILGDLTAKAQVQPDTTSISITNKIFDLNLKSNTDPITFGNALKRHVSSYFYNNTSIKDNATKPVNLIFQGHLTQTPILNDVFLVNLKDLDTIDIALNFNESKRKLKANITAPHIKYNAIEIDSLNLTMDTDINTFAFNFGFNKIKAGPLALPKSNITGNQLDDLFSLNVLAYHEDKEITNIKAEITRIQERLRFHLLPKNLIINKQNWNIPNNNEIVFRANDFEINNFKIKKNNQTVGISNKNPSITEQHIAIDFKNFQLNELFTYLNPNKKIASGNLSGNFTIEQPLTNTGFIADLVISKLALLDVDLGTLHLKGTTPSKDAYNINIDTKGGAIDMDIAGQYLTKKTSSNLNLDIAINAFNMHALNAFTQGAITDASGILKGEFKIDGSASKPNYKGHFIFNNANFKVTKLNSAFTLKNEKLIIDNSGLFMRDFTVLDAENNSFLISGMVGTETFLNPTFDLKMKAKNFQMLNATQKDNELLYGKINFDANATITGDLQIPKIAMDLKIGNKTNATYVMPSTTANIEERDGVVVFVNRENPDAILTRTKEKSATLKGFDINAKIKVNKNAAVTIIIDENTGDNFKVAGDGDLNFTIKPNGNMNLAGTYEVSQGHYEMNLYNIVNRKFNLAKGSRVTWSGNPFDAKLDVKAIYNIETAASALMANTPASDDGRYRQVLPFLVYLNIDGELLAPKITFNLNMPEDEQGAIGGQVFSRVQQINQQKDELNKQVFSLLVLNRFYPNPGSDGSQGGVATIARDNLNDALSDQLNMFSDKIFGKTGFEVDFGVNSFTDYQGDSPQDRTQLDIAAQKKLLNDRLIVRVGSEIDIQGSSTTNKETPLVGNVSLQYLLTENGRYKLKGFRKNEFENVIDGQTIVTGIGLIFTKEFNKFSSLWRSMFKSEKEENKADEFKKEEQ